MILIGDVTFLKENDIVAIVFKKQNDHSFIKIHTKIMKIHTKNRIYEYDIDIDKISAAKQDIRRYAKQLSLEEVFSKFFVRPEEIASITKEDSYYGKDEYFLTFDLTNSGYYTSGSILKNVANEIIYKLLEKANKKM